MKATKLMIGDWVYDTILKCNTQVEMLSLSSIRGDCNDNIWNEKTFEPIPLTDEILEKNGFEYYHKNYASLSYGHPLQIAMDRWPDENGLNGLWRIGGIIEIRYVHELQHALRLCGIDKEITISC